MVTTLGLPQSIQAVDAVLGLPMTLKLIDSLPVQQWKDKRWNGRTNERVEVYVPTVRRLKPDHPIAQAVGFELAQDLAEEFGGSTLRLPLVKHIPREE